MKKLALGVLLLLAIAAAYLVGSWSTQRAVNQNTVLGGRKILYYVDPMHPAYKSDKPGIAPDCGMELVPVYEDGAAGGADAVRLYPGSVTINRREAAAHRRQSGSRSSGSRALTLRVPGRVAAAEDRMYRLIAASDGWVQRCCGRPPGASSRRARNSPHCTTQISSRPSRTTSSRFSNTAGFRQACASP